MPKLRERLKALERATSSGQRLYVVSASAADVEADIARRKSAGDYQEGNEIVCIITGVPRSAPASV